MKLILNISGFFIQIGIFILVLSSIFTLLTSKSDIVNGFRSFVVVSGSMQPSINVGSVILTVRNPSYRLGEIVSYKNNSGQVVTHRIINKATVPVGTFYEMKGDANSIPDNDPVNEKSIIGKTVMVIPYLGKFIQKLKTPYGFIGFIIAPASLLIIWELRNIKKELEKDFEKKFQYKYHRMTFS